MSSVIDQKQEYSAFSHEELQEELLEAQHRNKTLWAKIERQQKRIDVLESAAQPSPPPVVPPSEEPESEEPELYSGLCQCHDVCSFLAVAVLNSGGKDEGLYAVLTLLERRLFGLLDLADPCVGKLRTELRP